MCCLAWYIERISVKPRQNALTQPPSAGQRSEGRCIPKKGPEHSVAQSLLSYVSALSRTPALCFVLLYNCLRPQLLRCFVLYCVTCTHSVTSPAGDGACRNMRGMTTSSIPTHTHTMRRHTLGYHAVNVTSPGDLSGEGEHVKLVCDMFFFFFCT